MADQHRQVLPFTLTEIFVLLFFALALALAWERSELEKVRTETEDYAELIEVAEELGPVAMEELSRVVLEASRGIPEEFTELTRLMEEQGRARQRVLAALVERGADSTRMAEKSTAALVDTLAFLSRQDETRFNNLLAAAGADPNAADAIDSLAAEVTRLDDRSRELANQVAYYQRASGNGLDHPPCWADDAGEIEYAFVAVLHTGTVDLRPTWPERRQADAEAIRGMLAAAGEGLSHSEFRSRVTPILQWSMEQNPECRHFVVLVDEVADSKDAFKAGMLTVEQFFYKRLEN